MPILKRSRNIAAKKLKLDDQQHKSPCPCRKPTCLASVPDIGPIIATALAATVVEPSGFRSGREFAAWLV
jgi:transposase